MRDRVVARVRRAFSARDCDRQPLRQRDSKATQAQGAAFLAEEQCPLFDNQAGPELEEADALTQEATGRLELKRHEGQATKRPVPPLDEAAMADGEPDLGGLRRSGHLRDVEDAP